MHPVRILDVLEVKRDMVEVAPIVLRSHSLEVTVRKPGTYYNGSRFDWTGWVSSITLHNRHTFCTDESLTPGEGTGGSGLCNEFGIFQPIGYEEALLGGQFPKLGVGLLTRPDEASYKFSRPYMVEPFFIETKADDSKVTFTVHAHPCNGYAAKLVKTLSVKDNLLSIAYELVNLGEKTIVTHEYCHNFVALNGNPLGPDYRLKLPMTPTFSSEPSSPLDFKDGHMTWAYTPEQPFYSRLSGPFPPGLQWELTHKSGVGMRESVDFSPGFIALWGDAHVISPEVFMEIAALSGQTIRWVRQFDFFEHHMEGRTGR